MNNEHTKAARGKRTIWHLSALCVGESQLVGRDETGYDSARNYAAQRAKSIGFGAKFSCNKVEGGMLITRTA